MVQVVGSIVAGAEGMAMKILLAAAVVAVSALACTSHHEQREVPDPGVLCPAAILSGMLIEVHDAVGGEPTACEAQGRAEDGGHIEPLTGGGPCATDPDALYLQGVWQAGVYTVTIEKNGYRPWVKDGIEVRSGPCGLMTVVLRADLIPL
jgi:hypothetical protein